jgi:hypothetical protein
MPELRGKPMKKVYLAYALLVIIVIMLLIAALIPTHAAIL